LRDFSQKFAKSGPKKPTYPGGTPMAVTVYTLPACVQCDSTKRMLQRNQIEYAEVDMSQDPVALEMVKTMGYTAAPVVVSGDEHWSGFRMDKIQAISA
jgi:glutaredoxin-like protein NrdH